MKSMAIEYTQSHIQRADGKAKNTLKFYKWLVKQKNEYRAILDTIDIAAAGKHHRMESHYEYVNIR